MEHLLRNVAVAVRIFIEILLMVFLRGIEVLDGRQLYRELCAVLCLLLVINRLNFRKLALIRIVDTGAVLNAFVISLLVYGKRIDYQKVLIEQLTERNLIRIILDFYGLRMSAAVANLPIGRSTVRPVCITHLGRTHARELVKVLL